MERNEIRNKTADELIKAINLAEYQDTKTWAIDLVDLKTLRDEILKLKTSNEILRERNQDLKKQVYQLTGKLAKCETNSIPKIDKLV